jgi:DNA repair exonuclease SbcCD nuclease subunit
VIAVIGDMHIGVRNSNSFLMKEQEEFFFGFFFPLLENNEIETVIHLGDFFDSRVSVNINAFSFANRLLKKFVESKIRFISILGNHDMYYKNSTELSCTAEVFKGYDSDFVKLVTEPSVIHPGAKILLVPWICESNKEQCLKTLEESDADYCMGHFELEGFKISKHFVSEKSTADLNLFSKFKRVFSGHYHVPSEAGNIVYVGTPYQMSWNDSGTEKRMFLFVDGKFTEYPLPRRIFHKFVWSGDNSVPVNLSGWVKVFAKSEDVGPKLEKFLAEIHARPDVQNVTMINISESKPEEIRADLDIDDPLSILLQAVDGLTGVSKDNVKRLVMEHFNKVKGG